MMVNITTVLLINNTEIYGDMIIELQNIWLAEDSIDSKITHTQAKINAVSKEIEVLVAEVEEIGDTPETAAFETLSMIVYAIALPGVGAIFYFLGKGREKRRRVQPDVTRGTDSARSLTGQRGARTRQ
jgi:hypothetical protein